MTLIKLALVEGRPGDLHSLFDWLQRNDELRGRIETSMGQPSSDEMGTAMEIISLVLGGGGVGAALAGSLGTWLQTRRARISVEIVATESGETVRKVEVDARNSAVAEELYGLLARDHRLP